MRKLASCILILLLLAGVLPAPADTAVGASAASPLAALLVGGGPDVPHNQVAIESNVRYVHKLLPPFSTERILFTDGDRDSPTVQFLDGSGDEQYRDPDLPRIDGPSDLSEFSATLSELGNSDPSSILLYFTGHGGPDEDGGFDNNEYDLWHGDELTVRDLARRLQELPNNTSVALVMVECYSGAFGNVIFQNGNPQGPMTKQDICGFFASLSSREAAGCTPEVDQADYHDFTSYFFAALTGTDRLGRPVTGADYDGTGVVGMNDAFAYTLIHDISIDTPVCTSDVFLRRYVLVPEESVFSEPYSAVHGWASPAQQAALDALSEQLGLKGEQRLSSAYEQFKDHVRHESDTEEGEERTAHWIRFVRLAKSVVLAHRLMQGDDDELKQRYTQLLAAEARNPMRPVEIPAAPND